MTCVVLPGAIRVAAPLPVVALILAVSGIFMSGLGSLKRNGKTIIAAVCYILAGEVCCNAVHLHCIRGETCVYGEALCDSQCSCT